MRVALFTAFFPPAFKAGGPVRSTANIVTTASPDYEILVVTGDRDLGDPHPFDLPVGVPQPYGRHRVLRVNVKNPRHLRALVREVRSLQPDIVYVNSLWSPRFSLLPAALAALRLFTPRMFLVAPRGELASGALQLKQTKKRVGARLWQALRPLLPLWWHASDPKEAREIHSFAGPQERLITSLNPVDLPNPPAPPQPREDRVPHFVVPGRISPVKNQHVLLEALRHVERPVEVHIYGVVHDEAYAARLAQLSAAQPHTVRFQGAVDHAELLKLMNHSDGVLLPTRGENFGHVIPEALSQSCPVFVDDVTPFTATIAAGGGGVVDHEDPAAWASLLAQLADESPVQRAERHRRAGEAYRRWRDEREDTHVLDLAAEALGRIEPTPR